MDKYIKQLKDFRDYMNSCFEILMEYGNDSDNDSFYNSDFELTFRGRTIRLNNGATVFCGIENTISHEIEELEFEEVSDVQV